ncbi:hypothetical protein [Edaphobacillus lindanitolerans]|uniref:DUF3168 domain-containing protein n=1 Tax=Edaphobacillus lindanitolerans TaxID=550447 RepID=A0A1U7PN24_9BACI|nr:hypothetical protein [Edaphobacillus lindanitolerans]SIT91705.1 hypothetical protein SAMN05428946_2726 [Edaphobacillus lindanitolerans]
MEKSPQQIIYDAVFKASQNAGYRTFDFLPAEDEAYPFVFIGEQLDDDLIYKSVVLGEVRQTVHIYHNYRGRGELTGMVHELRKRLWVLGKTEGQPFKTKAVHGQVIPDNSTGAPLLHGIIEAVFRF